MRWYGPNITYVNEMGFKTFGFSRGDFEKGITAENYIFPENQELISRDIYNIFHGDYGNPSVYRLHTKNGATLHVLINSAPLAKNGKSPASGCIVNISDRIAAEAGLKESEERFRSIFQQSPIGIALFKRDSVCIDRNKAFKGMFGMPDDKGSAHTLFTMLVLSGEEKSDLQKGKGYSREVRFPQALQGANAECRWFDWHVTPLGMSANGPAAFLAQVEDCTEIRKKQEAQLQTQREATAKAEALVAGLRHELLEKIEISFPW